jgi:hypothetical protein
MIKASHKAAASLACIKPQIKKVGRARRGRWGVSLAHDKKPSSTLPGSALANLPPVGPSESKRDAGQVSRERPILFAIAPRLKGMGCFLQAIVLL